MYVIKRTNKYKQKDLELKYFIRDRKYVPQTYVFNTIKNIDSYFNQAYITQVQEFIDTLPDVSKEYHTFPIPKHSGGVRIITAPNDDLKEQQTKLLRLMQKLQPLTHNSAYAYIKGRECKDALAVHQANQSKYMLKIDLKNFFPSCNKEFVIKQMKKVHPYYFMDNLEELLDICFLDNVLPQGAPTSPYLSNILMVEFDYKINKKLWRYNGKHFVYTRYADDIHISCTDNFNYQEIINVINEILKETPLTINKEKIRYGSTGGKNWNLGLILNKENNITVGHARKHRLKNMLYNFMRDYSNGTIWELSELQHLQGELAYVKHIEPKYVQQFIDKHYPLFYNNIKAAINIYNG